MPALTTSHLLQAIQNAQEGQFRKSLAAIRSAKALEPANVHILAIEKQLVRLSEFTDVGALSRDEREENFELLRILADRAKQDLRDHLYSLDQLMMGPDFSRHPVLTGGQRQATRNVLVNQYLLRADHCLARGDRDGALVEIHRIYVIDPGNPEAREQEARIAAWYTPTPENAMPTPPPPEPAISKEVPREQITEPPVSSLTVVDPEITRSATDGESRVQRKDRRSAFTRKRQLRKVLRVLFVVAAVASLASFLVWKNQEDRTLMKSSLERLNSSDSGSQSTPRHDDAESTPVSVMNTPSLAGDQKSESPGLEAQRMKNPRDDEATPIPRVPEPASAQQKAASIPSEPQLARLATFDFPENLQLRRIRGEVIVQVQINAEGRPIRAEILSSTNTALNQGVVDGIMRSEFTPGKKRGDPVTAWLTIPLKFRN